MCNISIIEYYFTVFVKVSIWFIWFFLYTLVKLHKLFIIIYFLNDSYIFALFTYRNYKGKKFNYFKLL